MGLVVFRLEESHFVAVVGREGTRSLTRRVLKTKAAPMPVDSPAQMTSKNAIGALSVFWAAVPILSLPLPSAQQSPVTTAPTLVRHVSATAVCTEGAYRADDRDAPVLSVQQCNRGSTLSPNVILVLACSSNVSTRSKLVSFDWLFAVSGRYYLVMRGKAEEI